jgi:D-sedoheptulose 7-phosphate isomerase
MSYVEQHLTETAAIAHRLDAASIERLVQAVVRIRAAGGRIFFLGVGGSAGNCSHAVNDFRKIANIECYAPTDNVSELTARANDEGWESTFVGWLQVSRLAERDAIFVLSVGGGDRDRNISRNLVAAVDYAKSKRAAVLGILGRDGGHTARVADAAVIIPAVNNAAVTAHTEAFQAVIWHLLVFHPLLKSVPGRWESVEP